VGHHGEFGHSSHSGNDVEWHEDDAEYGQLINDSVLVNVYEADCCIHEKVYLFKQKCSVAVQRFDIAHYLLGIFELGDGK